LQNPQEDNQSQYFLNANGGTENFSWISSVGYDHNKDNLDATYQRFNFRFQNNYRPINNLSLTTGLYYTQSQDKSGKSGFGTIGMKGNEFVPYMKLADNNGNALAVAKN